MSGWAPELESLLEIEDRTPLPVVEYIHKWARNAPNLYVSWLEWHDGLVVERTWWAKRTKTYGLEWDEVMRRTTGCGGLKLVRDLYYTGIGGWQHERPIWSNNEEAAAELMHDPNNHTDWTPCERCTIWKNLLNPDFITEQEELKYCGYTPACGDPIGYLEAWQEDHRVEMLGRLGITPTPALVKKAAKDRGFCAFLRRNQGTLERVGVRAFIYAYDHGIDATEAARRLQERQNAGRLVCELCPNVKRTKLDRVRVYQYVRGNGYTLASYDDYIRACLDLRLDLEDTKIAWPKDFPAAHDVRIREWNDWRRKKDEKVRADLYKAFAEKAEPLKAWELSGTDYEIRIPVTPAELDDEGAALHHCVGRMGYAKKMAEGDSVIAFCRKLSDPGTPYVTIETSPEGKLRQAHGDYNAAPDAPTMAFITVWLGEIKERRKRA